jgi:predicted unusual protein kinase regulating ubiquinone biosynthesis (AarF/ABC1/UbiB family)
MRLVTGGTLTLAQKSIDLAKPQRLVRKKGLLNIDKVPLPLPQQIEGCLGYVEKSKIQGQWGIFFNVIYLWVSFHLCRFFAPEKKRTLSKKIVIYFSELQGFWFELAKKIAQYDTSFDAKVRSEIIRDCRPKASYTFAEVQDLICTEIGAPIEVFFSEFDPNPIRVSQYVDTYFAVLREDSVSVEVNVQKPDLDKRLNRDLRSFNLMNKCFSRQFSQVMPGWVIDHLSSYLPSILDLRYESSSMRSMRRLLRKHGVYVGKLFRRLSSKHILVREYIDASSIEQWLDLHMHDEVAAKLWLRKNNIELEKVARRVYRTMLRQVCEDNQFIQNLDVSNIILLRDSHIAIRHCNNLATVDARFLRIFKKCIILLQQNAYGKFVDTLLLMCHSLPANNLIKVRTELLRVVRGFATRSELDSLTYKEKSLTVLMNDVVKQLGILGVTFDPQIYKIGIMMSNVDEIITLCHPKMNYKTELKRYAKKAVERHVKKVKSNGVTQTLANVIGPLSEILRFEEDELRKDAQKFLPPNSKLSLIAGTFTKWLSRGLFVAAGFCVWRFIEHKPLNWLLNALEQNSFHQAQGAELSSWLIMFVAISLGYLSSREITGHLAGINSKATN